MEARALSTAGGCPRFPIGENVILIREVPLEVRPNPNKTDLRLQNEYNCSQLLEEMRALALASLSRVLDVLQNSTHDFHESIR